MPADGGVASLLYMCNESAGSFHSSTVATDVSLCAPAVRVDELWIDVPHGALDEVRRLWAGAMVAEACETEVSQLGVVGRVKHDIPRLDVTMDNVLVPVPVKVVQR